MDSLGALKIFDNLSISLDNNLPRRTLYLSGTPVLE